MSFSQISFEESERIKKSFYISEQDEYNCSSEPLNSLVFSMVLNAMPSYPASHKTLKQGYIADVVRDGGISPCSLLLGMMYIRRLILTNQEYLSRVSPRDLFLVAMVVSSKYMNDEGEMEALTNSEWAAVGCTQKPYLDLLERDFLKAIDWRLYVPIQDFYAFVGSAEGRVALEQAYRRGWVTYTDLSAIWENSDYASMMKYTAKVAVSGVTLYLVCVSTLMGVMAALHPSSLLSPETPPSTVGSTYQQEVQSSANITLEQMVPSSQLMPTTAGAHREATWPGGSHLDHGAPLSDSPLSLLMATDVHCRLLGAGYANYHGSQNWWLRKLLTTDPNPKSGTHSLLQDVGRKDICTWTSPVQDTWTSPVQDTWTSPVQDTWTAPVNETVLDEGHLKDMKRPPWHRSDQRGGAKADLEPSTTNSSFPPSLSSKLSNWQPPFQATVEMLQAVDLGYHYKGTFHWDPFINSSFHHNESSLAGALTFIAQCLTSLV